jgi:ribosome-binding protein aMBF1 (putative translation factor)
MNNCKKLSKRSTDAWKILDQITGDDPKLQALIEAETINAHVAHEIYRLRTKAGLSQAQLAARVGTTQSVISRLEDADYEGHSLPMLQRIAASLNRRVEVRLVPRRAKLQAA